MIEDIQKFLTQELSEKAVVELSNSGLQPALYIDKAYLLQACFLLRDTPGYYFDFLANITAVDFFPEGYFDLVYHLTSIPYRKQLCLKVRLDASRDQDQLPEIPSVSSVWRTADWHEREAFDLMGIYFTDHPDLRRILMPDDWQGFPLRKDYKDPEDYQGIPIK